MEMQNLSSVNGVVLYRGKYGATQQYAKWLGLETGFPVFNLAKEKVNPTEFDFIILGSAVYAGRYYIVDWLNKNWPLLKDKPLVLFTVSGTAPDHPDIKNYFNENLKSEMREKITYFPLRGKLDLNDLNWLMRLFFKMAAKSEKDEAARLRMKHGFDYVKKENIDPVLEAAE